MSMDFEFYPLTELPSHRAFLQALVPGLASLEQVSGVWLTGSLARGDADRWSSVDLLLLWDQIERKEEAPVDTSREILNSVRETLGEEKVFVGQDGESDRGGFLRGIATAGQSEVDVPGESGPAAVIFELSWALSSSGAGIENHKGAIRPLYIAEHVDGASNWALAGHQEVFGPPDAGIVESQLGRFWLLLARLPAAITREEQLAAHMLLTELHALLIDLVVSLNGGSLPQARSRINRYLGPAQLDAFERSLGLRQSGQRRRADGGARWIGQAVALVVLYRWYAPQLAEQYSLLYPQMAEDTVLALLSAELENWPDRISTG